MNKRNSGDWLEAELARGLREVGAPPELWERVQGGRIVPRRKTPHILVWATAVVAVLLSAGVSQAYRASAPGDLPQTGVHCQNPAELRAWARAKTDIDVPLRNASASPGQFIGARRSAENCKLCHLD